MIFREIDGQPLGVIKTEAFMDFFTDHLFFRFFDSGRSGLNEGIGTLVDCLITMFEQRGELKKDQITREQRQELIELATKNIVNGLIQEGTTGIYNGAFKMYNYVGQIKKAK